MFDIIAFDADDTLWHNETLYATTQERFTKLLAAYGDAETLHQKLYETEMRNLEFFGYGIKSFTLSMIETALDVTGGQIQGDVVRDILCMAKEMLIAPVDLLDGVKGVVEVLSRSHTLMLITKGDLLDQKRKVVRSGLGDYFTHIEVVSEKTPLTYAKLLARYGIDVTRFLMVGNSAKSDVLPIVELGGHAVHIPYHITWEHEVVVDAEDRQKAYFELGHIGQLPDLVQRLEAQ
jgi:putative hydrolase of the HAD superfamily